MGESESGTSKHGPIQADQTSTIKAIARDALIIFLVLTVLGGIVVAIARGDSPNPTRARIAAAAFYVLFGIVGFSISGYLAPRRRWIHLLSVTVCVWLLTSAWVLHVTDIMQLSFSISAWFVFLSGVYLLVAMGIGGALSFALKKDLGDHLMRTVPAESSGPSSAAGTSEGYRVNWIKVAAVLSSNLFFVASCTGITWVSIPALKHIGGKYMARGEAPDRYMEVIVSIPDPAVPGQRKVNAVTLGSLPEFQREHPDHSFVIPARSGEIRRNGTSISYRATALGAGQVRVETDTRYDDPFGYGVVGSYEASEREVRPTYTNAAIVFENVIVGVVGACLLSLIGSILQWVQRRRQQRDEPSE